jgi:hypothetical protein
MKKTSKNMSKYVKLIARPNTWFEEGTEVYNYDCEEDNKIRLTIEEWKEWVKSGLVCASGYRISESIMSEMRPVGARYWDGEACPIEEFDVEIVDKER